MLLALQRRMMFYPEVLDDDFTFDLGDAAFVERWFASPSGNRLHALHVRARATQERRGLIVYWHGNAGSLSSWGDVGRALSASFGYDVVVVDYAGFGKSRGEISEQHLLADADAVYAELAQDTPEREIVVFGRSLGTGVAVHLGARHAPRAVLLETPYASIADVAARWFPMIPSALLPITLRSDRWMKDVRCPVHIFHGTADSVIPMASAELLKPLLPPSSTFTVVDGGDHNNLASFPVYRAALARALGA